jgi:D-xylose transport system permease protein
MLNFLQRAGFDPRFSAMLLVLVAIWAVLALLTGGVFLSPRNLYNLSIQTCVTGVMACGMVYLIVARQIDLSVGSALALTGMLIAQTQVNWLPGTVLAWPLSIAVGLAGGLAIGLFQGWWVAYRGVPAFVVTLAGYLMFRGAAFMVSNGQTLAPLHDSYQMLGGGLGGAIGAWPSTVLGVVACVLLIWQTWASRQARQRYGANPTPAWADALKLGLICAAILGFVAMMNSYPDPTRSGADGGPVGKGIAIPVLLLLAVAGCLSFVASHTRFGRYVFAYGGNPDAALLSGINTQRVLVQLFMLMGVLAALAGMITTARLNSGANSIGQMAELYVIAAAVIGGTSLNGGIGSVPGAIVGALLIQTLDNGMVLLDVSSAQRQVFIGMILIAAVWFDGAYNRKVGA